MRKMLALILLLSSPAQADEFQSQEWYQNQVGTFYTLYKTFQPEFYMGNGDRRDPEYVAYRNSRVFCGKVNMYRAKTRYIRNVKPVGNERGMRVYSYETYCWGNYHR